MYDEVIKFIEFYENKINDENIFKNIDDVIEKDSVFYITYTINTINKKTEDKLMSYKLKIQNLFNSYKINKKFFEKITIMISSSIKEITFSIIINLNSDIFLYEQNFLKKRNNNNNTPPLIEEIETIENDNTIKNKKSFSKKIGKNLVNKNNSNSKTFKNIIAAGLLIFLISWLIITFL